VLIPCTPAEFLTEGTQPEPGIRSRERLGKFGPLLAGPHKSSRDSVKFLDFAWLYNMFTQYFWVNNNTLSLFSIL
jgi:hypothetical protein